MPKSSNPIKRTAYWNKSSAGYYFGRSAQFVLNGKRNGKKINVQAVTDCSACSCGVGGCGSGGGCDGY